MGLVWSVFIEEHELHKELQKESYTQLHKEPYEVYKKPVRELCSSLGQDLKAKC